MEGMKTIQITVAALLVLMIGAIAGIARPEAAGGTNDDAWQGITVTGVGHVDSRPDEAELSLGMTSKGATARAALEANGAAMRRLIDAVKAAGVAGRDIKTQDVSVSPNYEDGGTASGYAAHNSASARIRQLERAGAVLDAAARAGATDVYGPTLSRSDREGLEAKALENAFANARKRAEALAAAAGARLGRVTAIVEGPAGDSPPVYAMARAKRDAAETPIEPGTEQIDASVTVTFAIE